MEYGKGPGRLKNLSAYLIKSLKFYDLKNEHLTRVIFLLILLISFLSVFIPDKSSISVPANLAGVTAVYLASTVYLTAFMKDLRGLEYSLKDCLGLVAAKTPKILASSVIYMVTLAFTLGVVLLPEVLGIVVLVFIIPIMVVCLMFLFNVCYIIDKGAGIAGSYRASRKITSRQKGALFSRLLGFNFLVAIPLSFVSMAAMASENVLIFNFVFSFVAAIMNLMQQRLIALMYMDLEYEGECGRPEGGAS